MRLLIETCKLTNMWRSGRMGDDEDDNEMATGKKINDAEKFGTRGV